MSLSKDQGLLKIDGDSTSAVKALDNIKSAAKLTQTQTVSLDGTVQTLTQKYGGLIAKLGFAGSAAMLAKSAFTQFQDAAKSSADLFSQFGEAGWMAAAASDRIMAAADGMIKVQTAAAAYNRLVNSDLKMTEETVQNLAKMSVDLGRKFGVAADDVMKELGQAIAGGELSALRRYGIIIDESEANLKANEQAIAQYGRVASETEKKNAKAAAIASEVDKRYKDVLITAGDVNEIEAKYTNTKQKNLAIVAKTMENTAKTIQSVKHAFADAKQEVVGFINGMDKLDERALAAIRKGLEKAAWDATEIVKENLGKNLTDRSWTGIADTLKNEVTSLTDTLNVYSRSKKVVTEQEAIALKGQILDRELLAKRAADEAKGTEEALKLQKANLKEQGTANTTLMVERRKMINEEIYGLSKTLEQQIKRRDLQAEILEKQKDLVAQYGLTEAMTSTDRMLQNLYNYGQESAAQLKVQQAMADSFVATIQKKGKIEDVDKKTAAERIKLLSQEWSTKERTILQLEAEVELTDDQVKKKKMISIEDRARLERQKELLKNLKQEQTEMSNLIGVLQNIVSGIFQRQKAAAAPTGLAPAWAAEYQRILAVIKRGNADAVAAIQREFGTTDRAGIKQALQEKNNALLQLERKYQEDQRKVQEETYTQRVAADKADLEEYEKDLSEYQAIMGKRYDEEKAAVEKLYGLKTTELTDRRAQTDLEKDDYKSRLRATTEHYQKLEALAQARLASLKAQQAAVLADRNSSADQAKKAAADVEQAETEVNRIRKEKDKEAASIEKAKQDELKKIRDDAKQQIITWGQDVLRSTTSQFYDAMTMSNEALKESGLTRTEMLKRGLKDTAGAIAKEAFLEAGMETGRGLAAVAMGNPKAAAHFAAAGAFLAIAGTSLGVSKSISAPTDAQIAARKESKTADSGGTSASVSGTSSGGQQTKVTNVYFSSGVVFGTDDQVVKAIHRAENEAERRGQA